MKPFKWYAALLGVTLLVFIAALFICPPAHAQVDRRSHILTFGLADTTAPGMADSSLFKDTRKAQRMWIWMHPSRPCRVAIAVYEGGIEDSSAVVDPDTSKVVVWPWSGAREFSADSLSQRETVGPTSVVAASYELTYEFPAAAAGKWGAPRGRWIALHSPVTGEWYTGSFTRIRERVLSASGTVTWINPRLRCISW